MERTRENAPVRSLPLGQRLGAGSRSTSLLGILLPCAPAFDASFYPRPRAMRNLAEPGPRNRWSKPWRIRHKFPAPRGIEIFDLRGTYVVDECLVLDSQLRVLTNVSDEYSDEEIDRGIEKAIWRQTAGNRVGCRDY